MTRYSDIARAIAARVDRGELCPGAELPSIRELSRQENTTASTVARAYDHLARAGVIVQGGRRRARIEAEGPLAARRLLGAKREFRLAGFGSFLFRVLLVEQDLALKIGEIDDIAIDHPQLTHARAD